MNVIRLSGRYGILALDENGVSVTFRSIASGTWRIVRCDDWQHDQRVIDALVNVGARPDVELIDPTGLLGGSRYGRDIGREEKAPIVQRSLRGRVAPRPRSPAEPPPPRKRQPRASL